MGIVYIKLGGKVQLLAEFFDFCLLGIQRVMLGPTALPFDSFSNFTRKYLYDYPQTYFGSAQSVMSNVLTSNHLDVHEVVHTHEKSYMNT